MCWAFRAVMQCLPGSMSKLQIDSGIWAYSSKKWPFYRGTYKGVIIERYLPDVGQQTCAFEHWYWLGQETMSWHGMAPLSIMKGCPAGQTKNEIQEFRNSGIFSSSIRVSWQYSKQWFSDLKLLSLPPQPENWNFWHWFELELNQYLK